MLQIGLWGQRAGVPLVRLTHSRTTMVHALRQDNLTPAEESAGG